MAPEISAPLTPDEGTPTGTPQTSQNWSGQVVNPSQMQGGTLASGVAAEWIVPSVPVGSGGCGASDVSPSVADWVGLGGSTTNDLIQAGTISISCTTPRYRFWTESLPNEGSMVYHGPSVSPGDAVIVWVTHNAVFSGGISTYFLENVSTGVSQTFYSYGTPWSGSSAEFIAERPLYNVFGGIFLPLPNFGYTYFSSCIYQTFGGWQNLLGGSGGNDNYSMTQHYDGSPPTLATASSVTSSVFTSIWQNAGATIPWGG